jgi:hypothetical protein
MRSDTVKQYKTTTGIARKPSETWGKRQTEYEWDHHVNLLVDKEIPMEDTDRSRKIKWSTNRALNGKVQTKEVSMNAGKVKQVLAVSDEPYSWDTTRFRGPWHTNKKEGKSL